MSGSESTGGSFEGRVIRILYVSTNSILCEVIDLYNNICIQICIEDD